MSLHITVPTARLADGLGDLPANVELSIWDLASPPPAPRLDLVVPPYMGGTAALRALDGVEVGLVQSQSIGYDGVSAHLPSGIRFANAASVHETSTAELAVALMLAAQRQLPRFVRAQDRGEWSPVFAESLADRRVLLVGFGGVGTAIARRLAPFEVEISAVARNGRTEQIDGVGEITVHAIGDLPRVLPDADIVVLSLPGGSDTTRLFDATMLAHLAPGALLVNVGRGPLVDTDALVQGLHEGRLRAALNVVEPEPLPEDHPLWSAPNLLLSPHVGGASTAMNPRITRLIRAQIERMLAGEPPLNVVLPAG